MRQKDWDWGMGSGDWWVDSLENRIDRCSFDLSDGLWCNALPSKGREVTMSHQMVVPSNKESRENYGDGGRTSKIPTNKDLFRQEPAGSSRPPAAQSVSTVRRVVSPRIDSLIPVTEKPYLVRAEGRVKFYRVQPRGKSPYFAITIDEQGLGPLTLIQQTFDDRGWIHVLTVPEVPEIPSALAHCVESNERCYGYDISVPDHYAFFDIGALPEAMSAIMAKKYPNPRVSKLPTVQVKPARTYLVIKT